MNYKTILIIALVIILAIIGIVAYNTFNFSEQTCTVGAATFTLPPGYSEGAKNPYGATNITNGNNTIFIYEYNGSNISEHINEYGNFLKEKNESLDTTKLEIDNNIIYKTSNVKNKATVHYWFAKGNKTYDIYKWDGNKDMDSMVIDLVKSMK